MNSTFFKKNRQKYFDKIEDNSFTVLFSGRSVQSTNDQEYIFEVNRNFYYLTGINQENVILVLVKSNQGNSEYLFIDENDPILVKWVGKKIEKEVASKVSGIRKIFYTSEFDNFIYTLLNPTRKSNDIVDKVYIDLERRPTPNYTSLELQFGKQIKENYLEIIIKNAYNIIVSLRMVKSPEEIELIKASLLTTKGGIESLMTNSKDGLYEYQLESYFDQYLKFNGQKRVSFNTIAASGKNATVLHYTTNDTLIKKDDLLLFDLGCITDFYISDITRCFPANGKFTPRQKEIYQSVLNVNKKCINFLKPGVTWKSYNDYANSCLIEELKKLGLIKEDKELVNYYWHSIGHFIGLDTHDPGLNEFKFVPGMVLTVEPGIYIESEGIGVRIEDDILITEDGCINLSQDIIKEVDEIEKFMNR